MPPDNQSWFMTYQSKQNFAPVEDPARTPKNLAVEPPDNCTLEQWRSFLRARLAPTSETPGLDARVLLAHTLRQPQSWLLAHPEYRPNPGEVHHLQTALSRLLEGVPLPYVIGEWAFFGLTFQLSTEVLIPRPETELLVEAALAWLTTYPDRRRALDLGTGSGCIAVSLAKNCPDLVVVATDIAPEALAVARRNAFGHQVDGRIEFREGEMWAPIEGQYDLICANLPYIPTPTLQQLAVYGREPEQALDGGRDGLDALRDFLQAAPSYLAPGGLLLAEIEASQGPSVLALARAHFSTSQVEVLPDLAGRDRLLRVVNQD
jgi:release factor glutamine methyltransferase